MFVFFVSVTIGMSYAFFFFFSSRRRHTRCYRDWSSDGCSSDLEADGERLGPALVLVELKPENVLALATDAGGVVGLRTGLQDLGPSLPGRQERHGLEILVTPNR